MIQLVHLDEMTHSMYRGSQRSGVRYDPDEISDIPYLPRETMIDIMTHLSYDNILETTRTSHDLRYLLQDRDFWVRVLQVWSMSTYEMKWVETMNIPEMTRLLVKWQSDAELFSMASDRYASIHDITYRAHLTDNGRLISYLDTVCPDPLGMCKALGELNDSNLLDVVRRWSHDVGDECAQWAMNGVAKSGTDYLLGELVGEYGPHAVSVKYAVRYNNLPAFKRLYPTPIDIVYIVYAIMVNGWIDDIDDALGAMSEDDIDDALVVWNIIDNDALAVMVARGDISGAIRVDPTIEMLYITSIEMIDTLMKIIPPSTIWTSLLSTLDGTPERLELLEYLDTKYTASDDTIEGDITVLLVRYMFTESYNIPVDIKRHIIDYVLSTGLSNIGKFRLMIWLDVADLKIARILIHGGDARSALNELMRNSHNQRYHADIIEYLAGLDNVKLMGSIEVPSPLSYIGYRDVSCIESLRALCLGHRARLDDVCDYILESRPVEMMKMKAMLDIVSYYFHIRGYRVEGLHSNTLITWSRSNVSVAVSMRDHISILDVVSDELPQSDLQILLGLAIHTGEISPDSTITDLLRG